MVVGINRMVHVCEPQTSEPLVVGAGRRVSLGFLSREAPESEVVSDELESNELEVLEFV